MPDLTANGGNNWTLLTGRPHYQGATVGPYMQAIPTNSLSNGFLVGNGTSAGGFHAGFDYIYDYNSGGGIGQHLGPDPEHRRRNSPALIETPTV